MRTLCIIPTGDEIRDGIVQDLDSPEIMRQMLRYNPSAQVTRIAPVRDEEDRIFDTIRTVVGYRPDLVVLIGGSGGGHRHSSTLGKDYTHTAIANYLDTYSEHCIYGKNGHMWTRLLCGKKNGTVIINVPGPYEEAKAAFQAFLSSIEEDADLERASRRMAQAVFEKYPTGAVESV